MEKQDLKYFVAWSLVRKIGPVRYQKLLSYFSNLEEAWHANLPSLSAAGLGDKLAEEVIIARSAINPEAELLKVKEEGLELCPITSTDYPPLLKQIFNPPTLLYYRGSLDCLKKPCLAIVGARNATPYGEQAARELASGLTQKGLTIISGLAYGIDAIAHSATLEVKGLTGAIIGSGLDKASIYPSEHRHLVEKIIAGGGVVISEYPIGTEPFPGNFPLRNRIISGLSAGTLVIEAKESSGSLITAKYALEQNRAVFAVPGNIYSSNSVGTNQLIDQGAKIVMKAEDILADLNLLEERKFIDKAEIIYETPEENLIAQILSEENLHVDKIAQLSKLNISALSGILTIMEMKGLIKELGSKTFALIR